MPTMSVLRGLGGPGGLQVQKVPQEGRDEPTGSSQSKDDDLLADLGESIREDADGEVHPGTGESGSASPAARIERPLRTAHPT